jgi:hypothetical protein
LLVRYLEICFIRLIREYQKNKFRSVETLYFDGKATVTNGVEVT